MGRQRTGSGGNNPFGFAAPLCQARCCCMCWRWPERHRMSEDAPELTAELVVDGAVPSQPVISPDGCWVAYVVAPVGHGGERRMCALWGAAADGSSPPWKLTAGMAADSDPRWAPDSGSVFFLSDRTGSRQLYRVRVGGGEAEVLTDWRGEISDAWPLGEGRLVAA